MAKIIFHSNDLGVRGTVQAIYDYAHHAEEVLGHTSVIAYPDNAANTDQAVVDKFSARFELMCYDQLSDIAGSGADLTYFMKYGGKDDLVSPDTPSAIHAVFQAFEPHGQTYAYISEWLADYCTGGRYPYVPYMVTLPPGTSQRDKWGIPDDAFVYGRYGGYETFDLPFVKAQIPALLEDPKVWCVFINTEKFIEHPRALFLPSITLPTDKSDFIMTCDAMIHGRHRGESFGLAHCEFLFHGRPVVAWAGGKDAHHRVMLEQAPRALYTDGDDFLAKARALRDGSDFNWRSLVAPFAPEPVMHKFQQVFVDCAEPPRGNDTMTALSYRLRKLIRR
ncbi:hypothetical protein [Tateyamaria sp. SN6-1]|uniref:hypothetical protein n=1 Tax=Tateyamaria sp. SN6-1 TaxID=3092148 RepID=UPI0039F4A148